MDAYYEEPDLLRTTDEVGFIGSCEGSINPPIANQSGDDFFGSFGVTVKEVTS